MKGSFEEVILTICHLFLANYNYVVLQLLLVFMRYYSVWQECGCLSNKLYGADSVSQIVTLLARRNVMKGINTLLNSTRQM